MGATAIALALGIAAGLLAGGRPSDAGSTTFRLWPALVAGVLLQAGPDLLGVAGAAAFAALAGAYLALVVFALANLRIGGMPIVLAGLALNAAAVIPNGGMPVRPDALVRAGIVAQDEVARVDPGPKRHLERDGDVLVVLGDVIPVPPLREVLSVGDLLLSAGLAGVAFRLLRPARTSARRAGHGAVAAGAEDLRLPEGR